MKKEYKILILILILAYILRVLPYLMGYGIPITDDSLRDFNQVKHIIENKKINFNDPYGVFPILHIIVFLVSSTGINALKVFIFFPQIFPVAGIFFFYLFLKKYFPAKQCLFASFLVTVFGPHIYWGSQPVRETIGLFFFPLIVYLFDKETEKGSLSKKVLLIFSFILLIMSHNWSTLMTLFFLVFYSVFFLKKRAYAFSLISVFVVLTFSYWGLVFNFAFTVIFDLLKFPALLLILPFLFLIFMIRKFNLDEIKKTKYFIFTIIILLLMVLILTGLMSFRYAPQVFINPVIILFLAIVGFFSTKNEDLNSVSKITLSYIVFPVASIIYLYIFKVEVFDTFRILEFLIFPLSILAAYGFFVIYGKINKRYFLYLIIIILILSGTFIYPPIFIYKTNFANTPLYDIRSDIRYIPEKGFELIDWANKNKYNVVSNNYVIKEYQDVFYAEKHENLILISEQDYRIKEQYKKVKDKKLGIPDPENLINKTANLAVVYSNDWGRLYK